MKGRYQAMKRNTPEKTFLSNYKNKNRGANMLMKNNSKLLKPRANYCQFAKS